jgi:hypothetical protein
MPPFLQRLSLLLALATPFAPAQTISGHVSLSDTSGPARFAHVVLKRIPEAPTAKAPAKPTDPNSPESLFSDDSDKKKPKAPEDPDDKAAAGAFTKIFASLGDVLSSATVSPTGDYTLTGLKPGSYYVHALLPGYIDPLAAFTEEDLASTDPATQKRIRSSVAVVTVQSTESTHLDLKLELGAAISGRILFEDGSPAAGWRVTVLPGNVQPYTGIKAASVPAGTSLGLAAGDLPNMTDMVFQTTHVTDDRGNYRISGLAPGPYIVRAILTAGNASAGSAMTAGSMHLTVLSGNATRLDDAKPITVATQEDRKGEDLTMPLSHLHTISGSVMAKLDGKTANSGTVQLREDADTSLVQLQVATIEPNGTFHFDYVSNGHYTLKIKKAEVTESTGKSKKLFGMEIPDTKTLRAFAPGEQKATVMNGDIANLAFSLEDVAVPEDKKTQK